MVVVAMGACDKEEKNQDQHDDQLIGEEDAGAEQDAHDAQRACLAGGVHARVDVGQAHDADGADERKDDADGGEYDDGDFSGMS